MSDRPMAQRHEFITAGSHEVVAIVFDPLCPEWPDTFGEWVEQDLTLELLRVVAERDEARESLAFSQQQVRDLAEWNAKLRVERDEARRALQEMEDAHSEETGERCRAEDSRDALGKVLLRYVTGDECGCSDGSPDQPPTAKQCAYCEAQAALHGAGLLPEEEA